MHAGDDLASLTAAEAIRAMRAGDIRAEAYAEAMLARAARFESLNAFRALDAAMVMEQARRADVARAAGGALGVLHGLPIPVKDSINTRALPTSNGTRALRDFRPRQDAQVLERLFAQGAFLFGKTNLHELSRGWTSNNGAFGAVRNPCDPECIPGGSSGGSAAAVGARIAPIAVAEDTWGSIRVPAAMCGVVGFRPTVGRYPNGGIMPLTRDRFDQVGPMARGLGDIVLFDGVAAAQPQPIIPASLRGTRLGVPAQFLEGLDSAVQSVIEGAFRRLESAGAILVRAPLPAEAMQAPDMASTVIACENVDTISAFLAEQGAGLTFSEVVSQASPNIRARYESNPPTQAEYAAAIEGLERLNAAMRHHFETQGLEALVFPPLLAPAPPLGDNAEIAIDGARVPIRTVVGRNTALGSCARFSSLVLPAGRTAGGLPVALEFDAPAGGDRRLLALGFALERALVTY